MDDLTFTIAFFSYLAGAFLYTYFLFWKKQQPDFLSTFVLWVGAAAHTVAVLARMGKAGYMPMSNMYESLSVFSWLIVLAYFMVEYRYKTKSLGPFVISIAFTMIAIASVLPRDIKPLVPALQSYWLGLHVAVTFIGEAAFAISYVAALLYIMKPAAGRETATAFSNIFASVNIGGFLGVISFFITALLIKKSVVAADNQFAFYIPFIVFAVFSVMFYLMRGMIVSVLPTGEILDDISYRSVSIGLPIFTLGGLVFGAIWAHKAWGTYWSWDPKETWALITWFIYAIYLHMRYRSNWRGMKAAYITSLGFISTLFTYFGVNYLLSGLHSYGRF